MFENVRVFLRLEGAVLFAASLVVFGETGQSWWWFAALFLWPDVAMLAYLRNARLGAALYNLVHTEVLPLAVAAAALHFHLPGWIPFCAVWTAHIGWDRALGYGLKYPTFFKDTHLQRI